MELTAQNVRTIFMDSLFKDGEPVINPVIVDGITKRIGFNPERLEKHTEEIISLLSQLPEEFNEKAGGGYSFLMACKTKSGEQWGEHRNMEELFALGIGIGKVEYLFPRQLWGILPGSVPYLVIKELPE